MADTFEMKDVNPQAWLTRVLEHVAEQKYTQQDELLRWRSSAAAAQR